MANISQITVGSTTYDISAVKLKNARSIQTNLASTNAANFDGTGNITPGVTGTLPIANGGTSATTSAGARVNLIGIGSNVISSTTNDTVANWGNYGPNAIAFFSVTGRLIDQPQQYGFVANIQHNTGQELHQLWFGQPSSDIYHRGGNGSGWGSSWKKLLDSSNYTGYTVTKTGGGASGTWGISITGSAATLYNSTAGSLTWSGDHFISSSARPTAKLHFGSDQLYFYNGTYYPLIHGGNIGSQSVNYANSAGSVAWGNITGKPSYLPLNPGSIEMYPGGSAGHGGFIDFHYNSSSADYTSRIIEVGSGNLRVNNVDFSSSGNVTAGAVYCTAVWAQKASAENQCGVSYSGGNLYFWGNNSTGTAGIYDGVSGYVMQRNTSNGKYNIWGNAVYGAVWNDYAEYRNQKEQIEPGYCVASANNGQVYKTTKRLQACDGVVSDTFGFAIGETDECKTPLAVAGRVLAYCGEDKSSYNSGDVVCAGPEGKVYKMTREEIREYPDRIVGIVSEIPEYETWGSGNTQVNGRIWIKVK